MLDVCCGRGWTTSWTSGPGSRAQSRGPALWTSSVKIQCIWSTGNTKKCSARHGSIIRTSTDRSELMTPPPPPTHTLPPCAPCLVSDQLALSHRCAHSRSVANLSPSAPSLSLLYRFCCVPLKLFLLSLFSSPSVWLFDMCNRRCYSFYANSLYLPVKDYCWGRLIDVRLSTPLSVSACQQFLFFQSIKASSSFMWTLIKTVSQTKCPREALLPAGASYFSPALNINSESLTSRPNSPINSLRDGRRCLFQDSELYVFFALTLI